MLSLFFVFPVLVTAVHRKHFLIFVQINTTADETDKSNPFRFANIGVEKFLELNSEQNHNDYCLAYVFTDRDFDDGVLGLAWVGAPTGWYTAPDSPEVLTPSKHLIGFLLTCFRLW